MGFGSLSSQPNGHFRMKILVKQNPLHFQWSQNIPAFPQESEVKNQAVLSVLF
jgi:hypothetical protein